MIFSRWGNRLETKDLTCTVNKKASWATQFTSIFLPHCSPLSLSFFRFLFKGRGEWGPCLEFSSIYHTILLEYICSKELYLAKELKSHWGSNGNEKIYRFMSLCIRHTHSSYMSLFGHTHVYTSSSPNTSCVATLNYSHIHIVNSTQHTMKGTGPPSV